VFCPQPAAPIIKSYSPELIVHPVLDGQNAVAQIEPWLERLHVLVIGPGLGRDETILHTVSQLICLCRRIEKPLVIDADGLFLLTQDLSLVKDYNGVILTPNAIEFTRLFGEDRADLPAAMAKLGKGVTVIEKSRNDRIYDAETHEVLLCPEGGSGRRCGGQGDLLAGSLATFYCWALQNPQEPNPANVACFAASYLAKHCNSYAFKVKGRSMLCSDMVEKIHDVFEDIFEHKE
jgi:ATP-dependent NAD(P)H-hydrate dehydratase